MALVDLDSQFYNFTQGLQGQLFRAMQVTQPEVAKSLEPLPPLLQVRGGYAESPGWFMIQAAEFDPEPLTVANLRIRDIYASERIVAALLEMLAGERWLAREGEAYRLTAAGRAILAKLQDRPAAFLDPPELPLPSDELGRLIDLLRRLFAGCLAMLTPSGSWCLAHSRRRAPEADAPPLRQINQFMADFNAFRDDAHMAAWQAEDVAGYVWEAFSLIVSGGASDGAGVYEKLFYRGYSLAEYEAALQSLVARGWLDHNQPAGNYTVTATGHDVNASVEEATDSYFYAPWQKLPKGEAQELQERLQALSEALQRLAAG